MAAGVGWIFYLLPTPDAVPSIYTLTTVINELVIAAVEIGRSLIGGTPPEKGGVMIREFACQHGLLGIGMNRDGERSVPGQCGQGQGKHHFGKVPVQGSVQEHGGVDAAAVFF